MRCGRAAGGGREQARQRGASEKAGGGELRTRHGCGVAELRASLVGDLAKLPGPGKQSRPSDLSAWGQDCCLGAAAWLRLQTIKAR